MTTNYHPSLYPCVKKIIIATLFMLLTLLALAQKEQKGHKERKTALHVGLIYPISSNGVHAGEYTNNLSFHAIAGYSGAETGLAAAGFGNVVKVRAGGLLLAGFSNVTLKRAGGAQLAGFTNIVVDSAAGFHAAGYFNYAGTMNGAQLAGFGNIALRGGSGWQLAGFFNKGANVTTQVAGFINVAKKVKGVQIAGFINIADSSEYPIGIVNIIRNGEKAISVSIDETSTTLISFRSGSKRLYGILGVGYNFKGDDPLYALEAGIGAHFPVSFNFRINTELVGIQLDDFKKGTGEYFKGALRIMPALRIHHHMELFAGPTFNYVYYNKTIGKDLYDHYLWDRLNHSGKFQGMYIGALAGLQWRF